MNHVGAPVPRQVVRDLCTALGYDPNHVSHIQADGREIHVWWLRELVPPFAEILTVHTIESGSITP